MNKIHALIAFAFYMGYRHVRQLMIIWDVSEDAKPWGFALYVLLFIVGIFLFYRRGESNGKNRY